MEEKDKLYDYLVTMEVASESEIKLVTDIIGDNLDTLNKILYARTGYRNLEQLPIKP